MEQTFIKDYAKSVVRNSNIPANLRDVGFDADEVAEALSDFINTGRRPGDKQAPLFLSA